MTERENLLNHMSLHLDRQLSADETAQLHIALERAPEHRPLFQALQQADHQLRHAPMIGPRRSLVPSIMAEIERRARHDRRLVGLTFLLGGSLSLAPSLAVSAAFLLIIAALIQPSLLQVPFGLLVRFVSSIQAFALTLTAVQDAIGAWALPLIGATGGLILLTVTLLWASKSSLHSELVLAQ